MFEFCQRVSELAFYETIDEMEKQGMGNYGIDKDGELTFVLNEDLL